MLKRKKVLERICSPSVMEIRMLLVPVELPQGTGTRLSPVHVEDFVCV